MTQTSPAAARSQTRAATCTPRPSTSSPVSSTSARWIPPRIVEAELGRSCPQLGGEADGRSGSGTEHEQVVAARVDETRADSGRSPHRGALEGLHVRAPSMVTVREHSLGGLDDIEEEQDAEDPVGPRTDARAR